MKNTRRSFFALLLTWAGAFSPSASFAQTTIVHITGVIDNTLNTTSTTFTTGHTFTIDFTLNLSASNTGVFSGSTWYDGAATNLTLNYDSGSYIGTISVLNPHINYATGGGNNNDSIDLERLGNTVNASGYNFPSLNNGKVYLPGDFFRFGSTTDALTSGTLVNPADISWTSGTLYLQFGTDVGGITTITDSIYGSMTSVSVGSAIPEPSTYAAFAGLGALGLAIRRRRKIA